MFAALPRRRTLAGVSAACLLFLCGCSTFQSCWGIPAVPANRLPPPLLGVSKTQMLEISMTRLRQTPPEVYQLAPGDVLGVYIENVLGAPDLPPPVHFPEAGDQPPAIGFPIPVREDGTVALPLVPPIRVAGMTLSQATNAVGRAYTVDRQVLPAGCDRIIVTLIRRREYRVLVVREESGALDGVTKRGTGFAIDLPAYENDLLHALSATGGMPGLDARNEILIYRGQFYDGLERDRMVAALNADHDPCMPRLPTPDDPNIVRIPLRYYPDRVPTFCEADIILQTGDIVVIQSRDREKFYTGGVLPGGEHLLPRDYDLDILGAIALAGGPIGSGGTGIGAIGGSQGGAFGGSGAGLVGVPPSRAVVLRRTPTGGQIPIRVNLNECLTDPAQRILIQPEDMILVQYTFSEECINAALNMARFNFLFNGFRGGGL